MKITNANLALVVAEAYEVFEPLATPILEFVSVEQVNDPLNDSQGEPHDEGYLAWLEYTRAVQAAGA